MWIYIIGACLIYLPVTLFLTYLVHQLPRQPVQEAPDWGTVTDSRIPAIDGGLLEVWRVEPEGHSRGVVLRGPAPPGRLKFPALNPHGIKHALLERVSTKSISRVLALQGTIGQWV